jgi:FKBP-type peptidyl-prolyl cis-trans isomerase
MVIEINLKHVMIVGAVLLIAAIGSGTYFYVSNQSSNSSNKTSQTTMDKKTTSTVTSLQIEDITVGTGAEVKVGDTVTVNYVGTLEDGTKFDSSYDRNLPFDTQIGVGRVIKGWDQGIVGMKVGGKRKLTIPSDLAYGDSGAGGVIPGKATLIFEIELLAVK